jgi:hypothetical protein
MATDATMPSWHGLRGFDDTPRKHRLLYSQSAAKPFGPADVTDAPGHHESIEAGDPQRRPVRAAN